MKSFAVTDVGLGASGGKSKSLALFMARTTGLNLFIGDEIFAPIDLTNQKRIMDILHRWNSVIILFDNKNQDVYADVDVLYMSGLKSANHNDIEIIVV
jgi:ABC-type Mn2+/Zn2+ transport system ATPase subunit